jgi:hypothetical protein
MRSRVLRDSDPRVTAQAIVRVNYIPVLSSERVPHIKKPATVHTEKKSGHEFQTGTRHQDRLADDRPSYTSKGPGSISGAIRFPEK